MGEEVACKKKGVESREKRKKDGDTVKRGKEN